MLTQTDVTIWHVGYDKETRMDTVKQVYQGRASCQSDMVVSVEDNMKSAGGGLKSADVIKLRIPTDAELEIKNGDRLVLALSNEDTPPKDAYTILHFADNRKLSRRMWHWKIICT